MTRYSPSTGCFYPLDIDYTELPADIIAVPMEDFDAAMKKDKGDKIEVKNGRVNVIKKEITKSDICADMWQKIKAERDARGLGGFKVGNKWFHSDPDSRTKWLGMVLAGQTLPKIPWKTMDGTFVDTTPALAMQVFQQAFTLDTTLFSVAEDHKKKMENSQDPATYDFSDGWPEHYAV